MERCYEAGWLLDKQKRYEIGHTIHTRVFLCMVLPELLHTDFGAIIFYCTLISLLKITNSVEFVFELYQSYFGSFIHWMHITLFTQWNTNYLHIPLTV